MNPNEENVNNYGDRVRQLEREALLCDGLDEGSAMRVVSAMDRDYRKYSISEGDERVQAEENLKSSIDMVFSAVRDAENKK